MTCKICNRSSCTESYHSLAEQERWERLYSIKLINEILMNGQKLQNEIINLQNEIHNLRDTLNSYTMT